MDSSEEEGASSMEVAIAGLRQKYQVLLDKSTVYIKGRWAAFVTLLGLYAFRVYILNGWFIVTYGLAIYLLNLFIGFLSPAVNPEEEDGPVLPSKNDGEFRPFSRKLPEFRFWLSATRATLISIFMSFFKFFDIPVFWPILLIYFILLFVMTMRRQIAHMIKHRYVPFTYGKAKYNRKDPVDAPGGLAL